MTHLAWLVNLPRFGAIVLDQALEQPRYSWPAQAIGWTYQFSNGLTFGFIYVALIGDARRPHWAWAALFAVGLELGMLVTPHAAFFQIPLTARFMIVTLTAHLVFGVKLGLGGSRLWNWFAPAAESEV